MMLVEETSLPEAALPVEALKRHMRLGTGFAEDDLQDVLLASFLRAALSAIEGRTGKALLQRSFSLTLNAWASSDRQPLPIAPVVSITQVSITRFEIGDQEPQEIVQILDPQRYRLEMDRQTPCLRGRGAQLPALFADSSARVEFVAGMAQTFEELPADIAQAVLMLAAHYDEYRAELALGRGCMPFGVTSLIARYCPIRMGFSS